MKIKITVLMLLFVMFTSTAVVMAQSQAKEVLVKKNDATVYVDCDKIAARDAFVYEERTYLPVRAVADAVGCEISYNVTENAIYIGKQPGKGYYLTENVFPVDYTFGEVYRLGSKGQLEMYNHRYKTGVAVESHGQMDFKLNGDYSEITAELGIRGNAPDEALIPVVIYRDGKEYKTFSLRGSSNEPKKITIPVTETKILRIQVDDWDGGHANVGLGDPMVVIK